MLDKDTFPVEVSATNWPVASSFFPAQAKVSLNSVLCPLLNSFWTVRFLCHGHSKVSLACGKEAVTLLVSKSLPRLQQATNLTFYSKGSLCFSLNSIKCDRLLAYDLYRLLNYFKQLQVHKEPLRTLRTAQHQSGEAPFKSPLKKFRG